LRLLVDLVGQAAEDRPPSEAAASPSPVPPALAVRWLNHAEALVESAAGFQAAAKELPDAKWAERLMAYAAALDAAAGLAPRDDLAPMALATPPRAREIPRDIPVERFEAAGFVRVPGRPAELLPLIDRLQSEVARHADALDGFAAELERHPVRSFVPQGGRILRALCRFELARQLRRRGPIARASEDVLRELMTGRLYPVVRELVAAMVRFEWYFEPLRMTADGREVILGGLATPREDLDARLLLNSAERTVVGLAWFLALHLLQPEGRRQVLVLDDPAGGFDPPNRAGFVATLRAFIRLARPEQVVLATHDDAVAGLLADELSPVDGWPRSTTRIRCWRNANDASVAAPEWDAVRSRELAEETDLLGLGEEPSLFKP
jgi:hypothetical protein